MLRICFDFVACVKLIAFELAGEDRERRENPVVSRLKIAFTRCTNVVEWDLPLVSKILPPTQTQTALCSAVGNGYSLSRIFSFFPINFSSRKHGAEHVFITLNAGIQRLWCACIQRLWCACIQRLWCACIQRLWCACISSHHGGVTRSRSRSRIVY